MNEGSHKSITKETGVHFLSDTERHFLILFVPECDHMPVILVPNQLEVT